MTADRQRHGGAGAKARVALVALGAVLLAGVALASSPSGDGAPWVRLYDHPADAAAAQMVRGDAQFFAMLAQDPTLARPEVMRAHPSTYAYRATRPGLGWLAWAGSLGQPAAVPWVLFSITVVSTVLLAAVVGLERPAMTVVVLALPGVVISLLGFVGPEVLGAVVAVLAVRWATRGREHWAMWALTAGGLLRETLLLVGVGLVLAGLLRWWRLAVPAGVYLSWWLLVAWRVERPAASQIGVAGFLDGEWDVVTVASAVGLAVLAVLAAQRWARLAIGLLLPHLGLMLVTTPDLWQLGSWPRWTLPLFAVLLVVPARSRDRVADDHSAGPTDARHDR